MRRSLPIFLLAAMILSPVAAPGAPVEINSSPALRTAVEGDVDVALRLIGGKGAVLMPGRDINLTFQTSSDAYVIIYNIDSEGYVHLLYPAGGRPEMVKGRKVYFLPEQGGGVTWEVGGNTGVEYIHAVAVTDPSRIDPDELYYLAQNGTMPEERRLRIDMDPFLAFNMIDEALISDAEQMVPSTDYTYFYVNRRVEYPGYLCYKCHSASKLPDPYAMECPEVDIEKIEVNEDSSYPYPQLFAVIQAGSAAPDDDYASYTYYGDNLALGDDGYDYGDQDVYLSIYYSGGYPYYGYWPGYWSWYSSCYPYDWYWDISWGIGWGWGSGWYCCHYPFSSWYGGWYYGGYNYAYWHGYNHGYWNGYWDGGGYPGHYYARNNRGSFYAKRGFTKRGALDYASTRVKSPPGTVGTRDYTRRGSLDYASTRVRKTRETTIASSRLARDRRQAASARSYRNSRLARQVTRERAATGFRSFETNRYNTGRSSRYTKGVYGNYGTTRSARASGRSPAGTSAKTRDRRSGSAGSPKADSNLRRYERSTTRTSRERSSTGRESTGSMLEKRVRERSSGRSSKIDIDRNSHRRSSKSRPSTRSGTSARTKRDTGRSSSGSSSRSSSGDGTVKKSTKSSSSSSRGTTSTRRSTTNSSRNRSTGTRSTGTRSSGSKSSGSRSSGSKSSGRSAGKSSGRKR